MLCFERCKVAFNSHGILFWVALNNFQNSIIGKVKLIMVL